MSDSQDAAKSKEGSKDEQSSWQDNCHGVSALAIKRLIKFAHCKDKTLLIYGGLKTMLVADCSTGSLMELEQSHTERVTSVTVGKDKEVMVSGGNDKRLVVWQLPEMKVASKTVTDKKVVSVVLDEERRRVVFAEIAGEVFQKPIDDLDSKAEHLLGHISSLTDMRISPSGSRLLTSDRDEKVRISNFPHAFEIEAFCLGHTELVTCIETFTLAEEELLLSGGADGSVRLWSVKDGSLLDTYMIDPAGEEEEGEDGQQADSQPLAEEPKTWDRFAAGTAQATAAVSGRMRRRTNSPAVVALAYCPRLSLAACIIENQREVLLLQVSGKELKELNRVEVDQMPVGIEIDDVEHEGKAECFMLVAVLDDRPKLEAFRVEGGKECVVKKIDLKSSKEESKIISAFACLSEEMSTRQEESHKASGQDGSGQYFQKRRRHTEPGFKQYQGKAD
ncbi:hypothetical protein GUITHDRAFT_99147 [Guillardia theta CCMP2712]|uniref:tRNA (guanine-N(7)-)-methyltransferase non-catalytic subunit n=1 Tax=Guillardia theta (strain CCMP2712) TaxID=905079 RepID=L1K448_GUITC|nr:hypothetical protein GUITHDRAFT_99147 [Guillardia theta CCMP2712]EKX55364.1 hypothetical protein GUITHDRAFT_99147 [Guillardia theta CCMP2712]|eukprot:XP_005842344.1 hypothetical protein GUITHDRAFT_99147 [Guillardia theta CCMP2712]